MKSLLLLATTIASMVLTTSPNSSTPDRLSLAPHLRVVAGRGTPWVSGQPNLSNNSINPHFPPDIRSHSPTHQSAGAMNIPDTSFSPAVVDPKFDGTVDVSTADKSGAFGQYFHRSGYETFGFQGGYYQKATWQPSGATIAATFRYQGSVYSNATGAQRAGSDGVGYTQATYGATALDCSGQYGMSCRSLNFRDNTGTRFTLVVFQNNQCLAEIESDVDGALVATGSPQLVSILGAIKSAAVLVLKTNCGLGIAPTASPTTIPTPPPTGASSPVITPASGPTPVSRFRFSVASLRLLDMSGHDQSQFRRGETLFARVTFLLRGVAGQEVVTIDESSTYGVRTRGKTHWTAYGAPQTIHITAGNGRHDVNVKVVAARNAPGAASEFAIAVVVTARGHHHHRRRGARLVL